MAKARARRDQDVQELLEEDFEPSLRVQLHADGSADGCLQPCCAAAMATFRSSIVSAASRTDDGLQGVLAYLNGTFAWGLSFETHLCGMLRSADHLDCGAMTAIGLLALQLHLQEGSQSALDLVNVQVIMGDDPITATVTRNMLTATFGEAAPLYSRWLRSDAVYHQCIGIFSKHSRRMAVWDYGRWRLFPAGDQANAENSILAVKVNTLSSTQQGHVVWDGKFSLPLGQWVMLPTADQQAVEEQLLTSTTFPTTASSGMTSPTMPLSPPAPSDKMLVIYVTACHMSSSPMPGVGVARSLRSWYSTSKSRSVFSSLQLVGVDDSITDTLTGLIDPVFDQVRDIALEGKLCWRDPIPFGEAMPLMVDVHDLSLSKRSRDEQELWDGIVSMLLDAPRVGNEQDLEAFFLPCSDRDVAFLAAKKSALLKYLADGRDDIDITTLSRYQAATERILCPDQATLALVDKPSIPGAVSMGCFLVPEHLVIDPSRPLADIMGDVSAFCDRVNYPVVIKASVNGAMRCSDWHTVSRCLSAYLIKCSHHSKGDKKETCFVQKTIYGTEKTIAFAAFKGELTGFMQITKTNVTDGGKCWSALVEAVDQSTVHALEAFVKATNWTGGGELEFIEPLAAGLHDHAQKWFIIDFNPRFPAWIYGGSWTGCNLAGDLIQHALQGIGSWSYENYLHIRPTAFSRTAIDQKVKHLDLGQTFYGGSSTWRSMKAARSDAEDIDFKLDMHQQIKPMLDGEDGHLQCAAAVQERGDDQWWEDIRRAADHSLVMSNAGSDLETPSYLLSSKSVQSALIAHRSLIDQAITASAGDGRTVLSAQMCLSVKTQPHADVLALAKDAGYCAECISMAEVRAAVCAGYAPGQIVLTGPGKFWEAYHTSEQDAYDALRVPGGMRFHAIFADSLADLQRILQRINDPADYLRADIVGIRFQQLGSHSASRFGVDGSSPTMLCALAACVRNHLPSDVKLGAHLHFASSSPATGHGKWLGMARAAVCLALDFAKLCDRPLDVMDFGGGWHPHTVHAPHMHQELSQLMVHCVLENDRQRDSLGASSCTTHLSVMFELGKSITERAGGVICRVLEVRELHVAKPQDATDDCEAQLIAKSRAIVVDSAVAEVSIPHVHPLFWRSSTTPDASWQMLSDVGPDEIWGRTCMEFDVLVGRTSGWGRGDGSCGLGAAGIRIPDQLQVGDFLLIGGCGAYDMAMQYDFGDGQGRKHCVVCPLD